MLLGLVACQATESNPQTQEKEGEPNPILGTWQLVYSSIEQGDSLQIKDFSRTQFIKIINETHFAFFNQSDSSAEGFYAGAGTYTLEGTDYQETLSFIASPEWRNSHFEFKLEFRGDTLVQFGEEDVPEAGIKRHIVEKYFRVE